MKKFAMFALVLLVAVTFWGCSKKEKKEEVASADLYPFEEKADEVVVTETEVTFSDFFGTQKTLKRGAYSRVISLYHSHTALWYEAGGKLVGRVHTQGAEKQLPAEALSDEVVVVANGITINTISVEQILKEKPDLVILGQAMGQPGMVPALASAGIETIVVDYNDLCDYLKWFKVFSALNNTEPLYDSVALQTMRNVISIIEKVPAEGIRPTVLPVFSAFGKITVSLSGTALGNMIEQLEAINVADKADEGKDGRIEMNLESIISIDPDIIIIQSMDDETAVLAMERDYSNNKLWNSLSAVKNNRVYFLDSGLFHYRPHSRYDDSYQLLFDIFYPSGE